MVDITNTIQYKDGESHGGSAYVKGVATTTTNKVNKCVLLLRVASDEPALHALFKSISGCLIDVSEKGDGRFFGAFDR